jgi:hypothetical protein
MRTRVSKRANNAVVIEVVHEHSDRYWLNKSKTARLAAELLAHLYDVSQDDDAPVVAFRGAVSVDINSDRYHEIRLESLDEQDETSAELFAEYACDNTEVE